MKLNIQGFSIEPRVGQSLLSIIRELGLDSDSLKDRPLAADLGGEVFTLNYIPLRETDTLPQAMGFKERKAVRQSNGVIKLIGYREARGKRVYERTLLFVFILAVRKLFPKAKVKVQYAIGNGIYVEIHKDSPLTEQEVLTLREKCLFLIQEDFPLNRVRLDIDDAIAFFEADGQQDKAELLRWRQFSYFDVYRHDGYMDYFYGEMCPSSGYASVMDLQFTSPGLLLLRPSQEDWDRPAKAAAYPTLMETLHLSDSWGELMHCATVHELNAKVEDRSIRELVRVNEALHEKRFAQVAQQICDRGAKVILIAGPSSSGKTTSANRLCTQLRVLGKTPLLISLDDYYRDRSLVEPEPDGSMDYEHIKMIDVEGLQGDLSVLLAGGRVELPTFDFATGRSLKSGRAVTIDENTPLVLEGIHALNPALLPEDVGQGQLFKLYVSALTTLNLDDHNRIPVSDVRLLRRLVRDYLTRGASVERTLLMWDSVRRGESRWIFPYQEQADAFINTALVYELSVLKRHIFPLLNTVTPQNPCYDQVRNIVKFLNYVQDVSLEDEIPPTSILREFIGGNSFYRK